jgi:hypothetical protein
MSEESSLMSKLNFLRSLPNLITLSLVVSGLFLLAWVIQLTWIDISVWNKDIGTILVGSRTNEQISLGIGMTVMNYLLIGVALIAVGSVVFIKKHVLKVEPKQKMAKMPNTPKKINAQMEKSAPEKSAKVDSKIKPSIKSDAAAQEEQFFSGCLHHFGYLSSRPRDSPIPQECILCQRLGDCMVATVYVNKINK